jgi:hypothetical protein
LQEVTFSIRCRKIIAVSCCNFNSLKQTSNMNWLFFSARQEVTARDGIFWAEIQVNQDRSRSPKAKSNCRSQRSKDCTVVIQREATFFELSVDFPSRVPQFRPLTIFNLEFHVDGVESCYTVATLLSQRFRCKGHPQLILKRPNWQPSRTAHRSILCMPAALHTRVSSRSRDNLSPPLIR